MFESIKKFNSIKEMVGEAMSTGRPAACRMADLDIYRMLENELASAFRSGRSFVDYDWRFLNATANGHMCFHSDGTLHGCYRFNGFARAI